MQPIATDSSSFAEIRTKGCIYVDKTAYFHELITNPSRSKFFIARPRRFGKSLMISTFKAIFEGRKDLFKGLAIEKTDYDWQVHPVLHFNLGFCANENYEEFVRCFALEVERALTVVGITYNSEQPPSANFGLAIDQLAARGANPVILIDEYDDPVAATLKDFATAEKVRDWLAPFYRQMKDRSEKIRFLMITGVSKFTKMSVFSALSNLTDISFNDEYAAMLGFTEEELDKYFGEHMQAHRQKMKLDETAYRAELKRMYDGYRFGMLSPERVYNPVSVSMTLVDCRPLFLTYWTSTGKSSFLMNFLKRNDMLALDFDDLDPVSVDEFDVSDLRNLKPVAMLFQTGYLTISNFNPYSQMYSLVIPNAEVRKDMGLLLASVAGNQDTAWAAHIGGYLLDYNFGKFFAGLKALYAAATYGSTESSVHESSYSRCLLFLLYGQGFRVQPEVQQASGRADIVADHPCGTYIFELKVDRPAAIALSQAEARKYAEPYRAANKPIWLIGLSFDGQTRCLSDSAYQEVKD